MEQRNLSSGKQRGENNQKGHSALQGDIPFNEEFEVKREQLVSLIIGDILFVIEEKLAS